jgi:rhodanese-related sulfurtransferase
LFSYNGVVNLDHWIFVKFIIDNSWLIGLILISGGALLVPILQRSGAKVSLLQATQLMNQSRCTILDVRDPKDFDAGHIRNAKNIPLVALSKRISELEKQKSQSILAVCASGTRSATASAILTRAGFANVVSLEGGMSAWREQGLPLAK